MKDSLKAGLTHRFSFKIPPTKTVPHLYPESESFRQMPDVLATGYLVGLLEWACIEAIRPFLDWPREQSLGTRIDVSHLAATPPGLTVTVDVRLERVEGRKLSFSITAHDGADKISEGTHERFVIDRDRFAAKLAGKARAAPPEAGA
jgi:fluoroacetyl-CoA thioesterase